MKKKGILNSDISRVLSYMGHTDRICIGDCGLPIPEETERIELESPIAATEVNNFICTVYQHASGNRI